MHSSTRSSFVCPSSAALLAAGFLALAPAAHAGLFLDVSGDTVLISASVGSPNKDDGIAFGSRNMSGSYFGQAFSNYTPTISINGHVNFVGDDDYFNRPLGDSGVNRIAPLWQDYNIGASGRVIETLGAGYYGITWDQVENNNAPGNLATFQAVFFESDTTLNGFAFLAGDIIFSYGDFTDGFVGAEPTIGLENDFGLVGGIAALPGTEDTRGVFYSDFGDVLPVGEGEFVLFRPDGAGYDVSVETSAIPEPSSAAALAGCLALAGSALRRRRR